MEPNTLLPTFKIENTAKENFDKYMEFMNRPGLKMDDLKRGRWTYEMYLKSCGIADKERRLLEKQSIIDIAFEVEGEGEGKVSQTRTRTSRARARK